MIRELVGVECLLYKDNFVNINGIQVSANSKGYIYNYMYSPEIYRVAKSEYFQALTSVLEIQPGKYILFLISSPTPNSKFNSLKRDMVNPISSLFIANTDNIIINDYLFKTSRIELNTKQDFIKALEYLYSGYYSHSFIMYSMKDNKFDLSELLTCSNSNRSQVFLNYEVAKQLAEKIYITYGGFDFGQFLFISF